MVLTVHMVNRIKEENRGKDRLFDFDDRFENQQNMQKTTIAS